MRRLSGAVANAHSLLLTLWAKLHGGAVAVYVGAFALVSADLFALIITAAAVWPVGIALLLALFGLAYYVHDFRRRRHEPGPRPWRDLPPPG